MTNSFEPAQRLTDAEHGIVYRDDKAFSGWPFTSGFWQSANGDYILGMKKVAADYSDTSAINHDQVAKSGPKIMTIRSTDKGRTWDAGTLQLLYDLGPDQASMFDNAPPDYSACAPFDFSDPDVLVACGGTPDTFRPNSDTWLRVSTDGGETWRHPIRVHKAGFPSVTGHNSFLVRADGTSLMFGTVALEDGWKRRPAVFASVDGGAYWTFVSFITPKEDDGAADTDRSLSLRYGGHRYFYPRPILLADGRILCSMRSQREATSVTWTEMFLSEDGGRTWSFRSRVNDWGAPGDLARMADGRIACVYGYRMPPYGIRARISEDEGRTWGRELVLRDDGGSWDLGYPRVIERAPGELLTLYYMNTRDDPIQLNGGVRHIAWTSFTPT